MMRSHSFLAVKSVQFVLRQTRVIRGVNRKVTYLSKMWNRRASETRSLQWAFKSRVSLWAPCSRAVYLAPVSTGRPQKRPDDRTSNDGVAA